MEKMTVSQAKKAISDKLSHFFGVDTKTATDEQYYKAVAMIIRDRLSQMNSDFRHEAKGQDSKEIYYLCMEFLMGRSLKNNLYNLDLTETFKKALESFDVSLDKLYEKEPDAGLGNGGLGRLAACYLDGLATNGFQSMGYSIRYEAGIFKQKLVDGWQTELPDFWLPGGEVWLVPREERSVEVKFEGWVDESWDGDFHHVNYKDCNAVPQFLMICMFRVKAREFQGFAFGLQASLNLIWVFLIQAHILRLWSKALWLRLFLRCFILPITPLRASHSDFVSSIFLFLLLFRILFSVILQDTARLTIFLTR